VQSLHKGAGALTQASIVHLNKTSPLSAKMLQNALYISTTTSPSSLVLLSIEETIVSNFECDIAKERIQEAVKRALKLREGLKQVPHVEVLEAADPREQDPMKLCVRIHNPENGTAVSGRRMRDTLREHGVDPEAFTATSCLITCNLGSADAATDKALECFKHMASTPAFYSPVDEIPAGITDALPQLHYVLSLDECYGGRAVEEVPMSAAVGRISADIKSPCPPGCIVLDIGQRIEEAHLQFFRHDEKVTVYA